ncbi:MAG TPA: hypothetical protein VF473_05655 [Cyclobacteriaceae bacterium]
MNLIAELGKRHSLSTKNKIVRYVGTDAKRFDELMKIFLGDVYRLTQWAGWPVSDIVKKHPELINPYLKPVLKAIDKPGSHVAVKRNVMRLLQFIDIPPAIRGIAFDKAFKLFSDTSEPVAVRVFAMTVMTRVAMEEPDLKNEVIIAIEEQLPYGSAAYKSRAARSLKALRK